MSGKMRGILMAMVLLAAAALSGCYNSGNADQYFSLPQAAEEYVQLQTLLDTEISSGSEYAAPTGGSYRQSVQLMDLNGDGESEALAFLRGRDANLKIVIYALENGAYTQVLTLQGEGSAIGSVDYADLTRDGSPELVVCWQVATGMNVLSVYNLSGWGGERYLNTDCAEFCIQDINSDGYPELMVIRSAATACMADMYTFDTAGSAQASTASLSEGITEFKRVRTTPLSDGVPALVVEASLANGDLVTDILVCRDGSFINLTMDRSTGISGARRSYSVVYSRDMNGDGILDIPMPQQLYSEGSEVFWSIAWYDYDSGGRTDLVMTTYHNYGDGWYFVLPDGWDSGLTVRRNDSTTGERSLTLSQLQPDGSSVDLITIYTLTGDNRNESAHLSGRFELLENGETLYAAELGSDAGITQDTAVKNFHLIYSEWSTGSV